MSDSKAIAAGLARCVLGLAAWLVASATLAQGWPERPVKVIVGSAAGSSPDIVARLIGEHLGQTWGQGVVVENRVGAGGNLGGQAAARAAPDGYTLWFAHATPVVMNQFLFKAPGFDAEKDFMPIVRVGLNPMMLAVHPDLPIKDLKDLIAYGKAHPGKISYATSGAKNIPHLVGETVQQITQLGWQNVPYRGSQQAAQDTLGGQTQAYIDAIPPMAPHVVAGGRLRPIAVSSASRLAGFESVPTMRESGVDLVMQGWMSYMAPAGTPKAVVDRVNRDVNAVLAKPDIAGRLRALGTYELGGSVTAFDAFIREERGKWESIVQRAGIERE